MINQKIIWQSAHLSDKGNVREYNEDACIVKNDIPLWVVADGMGGHAAGDVASKMITDALNQLSPSNDLSSLIDKIDDTLINVNRQLRIMGRDQYNNKTIGSTVVCMTSHNDYIGFLWAGDSRLYRVRDNQIQQLTRDHSEVQNLIDQGVLRPEEAESHPSANVITRAIGASNQLYLSTGIDSVNDGDTYILCSDGLYRDIKDHELLQLALQPYAEDICKDMMQLALSREAKDNITIIIAKCQINRE